MYNLTNSRLRSFLRAFPSVGWVLWSMFLTIFGTAVIQFYAQGLNLIPSNSFIYAGNPIGRPRPSYLPPAPTDLEVWGTPGWTSLARTSIWLAGCFFLPILALMLFAIIGRWRSYSPFGKITRLSIVGLSLIIFYFGYYIWGILPFWGLGD